MTKHYEYADTATINKPKLYERTEKSPLTSYADKFPKTARNYQGYILLGQGREFIKITHAETPSRDWGYIAQVDLKITIEFFGILFGATNHGTFYHAYEKAGGCGYDKHNTTVFDMMRHIGIEPYGEQGGHGGIYGHSEAGSKQVLQSIGNYLHEQYGLETSIIEI